LKNELLSIRRIDLRTLPVYPSLRPFFFRIDPEVVHTITLAAMRLAGQFHPIRTALQSWYAAPAKPVQAFGINFRNPVGLAAGYDKDGEGWRGLFCLGFGHIEVGTVTLAPQAGNPRPRLTRLPEDQALINRMGFPSRGAEYVRRQISKLRSPGLVLGVNLGMNKDTPLEKACGDYLSLFDRFIPVADYLAINVSSPNTVGLRKLQRRRELEEILSALNRRRSEFSRQAPGKRKPILVKLAPDLDEDALDEALEAITLTGMDGVIASNSTTCRSGLKSPHANEAGGMSGSPLGKRSTQMIRHIFERTEGKLPIIGVGGVMGAADAQEKLDAGAVLVQVYTGLVYKGPRLVQTILQAI
jgi:dihydroorotate dehydrogenase